MREYVYLRWRTGLQVSTHQNSRRTKDSMECSSSDFFDDCAKVSEVRGLIESWNLSTWQLLPRSPIALKAFCKQEMVT